MRYLEPALTAESGLRIRIVRDPEEFAALRPDWNALVARCRGRSVFLSHEWFTAAWQWRRQSAQLEVICLFRASDLAAVLPLVVDRAPGAAGWIRALQFLTVPDTQFCDLIVAEEDAEEASRAFAAALDARRNDWDVMRLRYLAGDSATAGVLRAALAQQGCSVAVAQAAPNPYVPLDASWDSYYATRSRSLKKANNLAANRLRKLGDVRIDWLPPGTGDAPEMDRVIDAITRISARSWKEETGNSLDHPGPQAFIRTLSEAARDRGWLSVWLLSLDGSPLAMEYQLIADGCVFALRSDFDRECESRQISPGSHLSRCILEQLRGQELRSYFMGPGENAYKYRWTESTTPMVELTVFARSARGRAIRVWEDAIKPIARSIRDRMGRRPSSAGEPFKQDPEA